jgi:hypothetical protein
MVLQYIVGGRITRWPTSRRDRKNQRNRSPKLALGAKFG